MTSRRRFLAASAAAALLPSATRAAGAPMPIFGAHVHFSHGAAARLTAGEAGPALAWRFRLCGLREEGGER